MNRIKTLLLFIILSGLIQTASADNLYLQALQKPLPSGVNQEEDKTLLKRIKAFAARQPYIIRNLPAFHKQSEQPDAALNLCQKCHGNLPHRKEASVRAFLNQHAQRIDCLVCHFQPADIPLKYRWLKQAENSSKRVIPVYQGESVVIPATAAIAKTLKEDWDKADLHQKGRIHQQIHQPLNFDKQKIQCIDCHQKQGMLDLTALGYDKEASEKIENNLISRFLEKLKDKEKSEAKPRILLRGLLQ